MVTRIGGLASGMDIDSIVEKLMSAEKAPLNKLYQQQQKYEWERDAYREVNTALSSFDDFLFDNYRLSSNFYKKTVASSNSNLVTATATSAASGTLSIDGVSQLAEAARGVGIPVNASSNTKISDLFDGEEVPTSIKINAIQANGKLLDKAVQIKIDENETVSSLVNKINSSSVGVTALFENGKLSITAKNMGNIEGSGEVVVDSGASVFQKLGFSVNDGGALADGGKNAIFSINGIETERSSNTFSINGYTVTLNSTFNASQTASKFLATSQENFTNAESNLNQILTDLASKYSYNYNDTDISNRVNELKTALEQIAEQRQSDLDESNETLTKARNVYLIDDENLRTSYTALSDETRTFLNNLTDEQRAELSSTDLNNTDLTTLSKLSTEQIDYLQGLKDNNNSDFSTIDSFTETELSILNKPKTAGQVYDSLSDAAKEYLPSYSVGASLTDVEGLTENDKQVLNSLTQSDLGALLSVNTAKVDVTDKTTALKETQTDMNLLISRVDEYNSAQKNVEEATALVNSTPPSNEVAPVKLTSSTDVDNMVDKIKKFVETYNGLVTTINGKLKETYDRNYPPLTDEQKEDMSEDEIEKWEAKAKTGLLRNDSILTNGLYGMRSTFMNSVGGLGDATIDALAEIGITTSSTTSDGGKLVIDEDKLRTAIEKDADQVAAIFTNTGAVSKDPATGKTVDSRGIAQRLRDELKDFTGQIEKKAGKASATNQTFTIGRRLDEVEDSIDRWLEKLKNTESRYWKQFTAMEQAINKANSQSSLFQPSM